MSTHNVPFQYMKENQLKLSQICSCWIFSKGLKDEFEAAVVNEPSVFEPLKVYCIIVQIMKLSAHSAAFLVSCSRGLHYSLVSVTTHLHMHTLDTPTQRD